MDYGCFHQRFYGPFRAFVGDNLPENNVPWDYAKFFYWDWRLLRIKTTVNFTYLGVDNTAPLGIIPDSVKYSFYFGGIAFIVTVLWTVITSKEYSPENWKLLKTQRNHFHKRRLFC
jgi:maltose/moltooligosaccharide transporter